MNPEKVNEVRGTMIKLLFSVINCGKLMNKVSGIGLLRRIPQIENLRRIYHGRRNGIKEFY